MSLVPSAVVVMALVSVLVRCDAIEAAPQSRDPLETARKLLAIPPRPARPSLPPSTLPLEFIDGERIALIGNSTAERMNLFGHFETLLHQRFPAKRLVFRNFGWPADEVSIRERPWSYTNLDDPVAAFGADTFFLFFGFNESFAGVDGVETFKKRYEKFLDDTARRYPRDDTHAPPRFVIVSPIAVEEAGSPHLPDAVAQNMALAAYRDAAREVAAGREIAFVDLFDETRAAFGARPGLDYTVNGCHVNDEGDALVARLLDKALFGPPPAKPLAADALRRLRSAVNDKSWVHMQDYRMVNGWYIYGNRRTWDTETYPREYLKVRRMVAVRDALVWDIAAGRTVPPQPDDSNTGELIVPPTRFGAPQQSYSENAEGGPVILDPDELIKTCKVPPGFAMELFADERRFPELAKPVQLAFDNKGRLWVATMPSYPQWRPGDPRAADKLVILEDHDGDGKADTSTVFYDKLHCPTGFQFFDGGVLVMDQPRMLWLKDDDGDDKADTVMHVFDGFATEDTHHAAGAFEMSPGGLLHALEGVVMCTNLETPWGPFRNRDASGCFVIDPRSWKVRRFATPGHGNPWCYVFDEWGQGICGDGTTAAQHWDTPLSGAQYVGRKGMDPVFPTEELRPVVGSEFLRTRQFPDDVQGQFLYACVINMNGMPRWRMVDDGAGYRGERVRVQSEGTQAAGDLLVSSDKHFRPVDPQIGPDGTLWFGDWANPVIGHAQYSQRDPSRDHDKGRIYRLVCTERPLLDPVTQYGRPTRDVLDQLLAPEWRTRYRARSELQSRPQEEVLGVAREWLARQEASSHRRDVLDRLKVEVLWLQQSFHAIDHRLLDELLVAETPEARAAALRVVADNREQLTDAEDRLASRSTDPHPRVRCEAARGLSFFPTGRAMGAVVAAADVEPTDRFIASTCEAALGANLAAWREAHARGDFVTAGSPAAAIVDRVLGLEEKARNILPLLEVLIKNPDSSEEERSTAIKTLARMKGGDPGGGKAVFGRVCAACHRVGSEGAKVGPDLAGVGSRLKAPKIVESIIDPNAEVADQYLSTSVLTNDGRSIVGLVISDTPEELVIFDGKEQRAIAVADIDERTKLRQSSMPDGLAAILAPHELLDVIAYLKSLRE